MGVYVTRHAAERFIERRCGVPAPYTPQQLAWARRKVYGLMLDGHELPGVRHDNVTHVSETTEGGALFWKHDSDDLIITSYLTGEDYTARRLYAAPTRPGYRTDAESDVALSDWLLVTSHPEEDVEGRSGRVTGLSHNGRHLAVSVQLDDGRPVILLVPGDRFSIRERS
jgi:hypothetical protein